MSVFNVFRKTIAVKRYAAPAQDPATGDWIEGAESTFDILCSVQPLGRSEVEFLPEGRREEHAYKIYTNSTLQTLDSNTNPDKITIGGIDYELYSRLPWSNSIITHNKYLALKVKES